MKPRATACLTAKLERNLLAYAAAAASSTISTLVLTSPVSAEVVYTPAHEVIGPNTILQLDLNHDGIADFSFSAYSNLPELPDAGSTNYFANLWPLRDRRKIELHVMLTAS